MFGGFIIKRSWKTFGIGLSIGLGCAGYMYMTPEKTLMTTAKHKFDKSYTYEGKRKILSYIPEPKMPILEVRNNIADFTEESWAELLIKASKEVNKSWLLKTINYMREQLIFEVNNFDDINIKIEELHNILPSSLELSVLLEEHIQKEIIKNSYVSTDLLNKTINHSPDYYEISAKLVELAISSYPAQFDSLLLFLQHNQQIEDKTETVNMALNELKKRFDKLHPIIQNKILNKVITNAIVHLQTKPELYDKLIDKHITSLIRQNELAVKHVDDIKTVFKNLPARLQSKMILSSLDKKDDNNLITLKDMFGHSVVLIKLGQIASEDPKLPEKYRNVLSSLRDSNVQQPLIDFWSQMPESLRSQIDSVGKCLGVGSIKQVHEVNLIKNKENKENKYVLCCIKRGIEDDALSTFKALEKIPKIEGLVNRLKKIVMREMNLWLEAEAFDLLKKSNFGRLRCINIPEIISVTSHYLIRSQAVGTALSKMNDKTNIMTHISIIQKEAIILAFNEGIIISDFHFGNQIYNEKEDKIIFFDLGQDIQLARAEANALIWTLAALSDNNRLTSLKTAVMSRLSDIVKLDEIQIKKLSIIYDSCRDIKDMKERIMFFLTQSEKETINLPLAFFSCAKMLDSLLSQEKILNLPPLISQEVGILFKNQLSYMEFITLGLTHLVS